MKKSKMTLILFLIWGGITIFAGIVGFIKEYRRSEGYYTEWRPAAKLPVPDGRLISATTHSVYVQGDNNSIYRLFIFDSENTDWEKLSRDESIPSLKFKSCGVQYKEHSFSQPYKQEMKTSFCSSSGYDQTDFVLTNDNYVWY